MTDWSDHLGDNAAITQRNAHRSLRKYRSIVQDVASVCGSLAQYKHPARGAAHNLACSLQETLLEYLTALAKQDRYKFGDKRRSRKRKGVVAAVDADRLSSEGNEYVKRRLSSVPPILRHAAANGHLSVLLWLGPDRANCDSVFWDQVQQAADHLAHDLQLIGWF